MLGLRREVAHPPLLDEVFYFKLPLREVWWESHVPDVQISFRSIFASVVNGCSIRSKS